MIPCDTAGYKKTKEKKNPGGKKTGNVSPEPMQCHDPYKIIMIYKRSKS